jgi:hypothetical protein
LPRNQGKHLPAGGVKGNAEFQNTNSRLSISFKRARALFVRCEIRVPLRSIAEVRIRK